MAEQIKKNIKVKYDIFVVLCGEDHMNGIKKELQESIDVEPYCQNNINKLQLALINHKKDS